MRLLSSPRLVKPSVRISRTGLSCALQVKGYVADRGWTAFRERRYLPRGSH